MVGWSEKVKIVIFFAERMKLSIGCAFLKCTRKKHLGRVFKSFLALDWISIPFYIKTEITTSIAIMTVSNWA